MWLTDCVQGTEIKTSAQKFVITLRVAEGCDPIVRASELIGQGYRNRISFTKDTPLYEVFVQDIADKLTECLSEVGQGVEVISFQDLLIEIPGLTLSGAHLLVSKSENDSLHIIFRFRFFLGSLNRAFIGNVGLDESLEDENQRLAALVISELALPILNICEAAKTGLFTGETSLSSFGEKLAERAHEISFQIELVKRFIKTPETVFSEKDCTLAIGNARKLTQSIFSEDLKQG